MNLQADFRRPQIARTRTLPRPNAYILMLENDLKDHAFNEERAPLLKGRWRNVFNISEQACLDLEIGTGNGAHFQHYVKQNPDRCLLGIELKYKPLIQTIRGAIRQGCSNGRVARYHALNIDELFVANELDHIFVHFPDPWTTPRKPQNRVMNARVLNILYDLQKPGSFLEFKTDSREYFLWAVDEIKKTKYQIESDTLDLHAQPASTPRFMTGFERIFVRKGTPINYLKLRKPAALGCSLKNLT